MYRVFARAIALALLLVSCHGQAECWSVVRVDDPCFVVQGIDHDIHPVCIVLKNAEQRTVTVYDNMSPVAPVDQGDRLRLKENHVVPAEPVAGFDIRTTHPLWFELCDPQ